MYVSDDGISHLAKFKLFFVHCQVFKNQKLNTGFRRQTLSSTHIKEWKSI